MAHGVDQYGYLLCVVMTLHALIYMHGPALYTWSKLPERLILSRL